MRNSLLQFIVAVTFVAGWWSSPGIAQDGSVRAAPQSDESAEQTKRRLPGPWSSRIEEALPSVTYLPDKDGNLQAVLNFRWEDFEAAYLWAHGLAQPGQSQFAILRFTADGTATEQRAELTIRIVVQAKEDGDVWVPLGLDHCVLSEPAEYQGPGEGFIHCEEKHGHVAWLRGKSGQQHELTLKVLVPLQHNGQETQLGLLAPRATESSLTLEVPTADASGSVSEPAILQPPAPGAGGGTTFTARGLRGDFHLAWRPADVPPMEKATVLEAEGTILVRIEKLSVDTEATLSVSGSGSPFDRIRVCLPLGAELVPSANNGYSVEPMESGSAVVTGPRTVEIRRPQAGSSPMRVRLITTRRIRPGESFELGGFEVLDAVRQWGTIGVGTVSDWQILWSPSPQVRRLEQLPEEFLQENHLAGFGYDTQPFSLSARLEARKTRINVDPVYQLVVESGRVRLKATLRYAVRGPKTSTLFVAMPGWVFDEVQPANLAISDRIDFSDDEVLSIPLTQPLPRQFELIVTAHRLIPEGMGSLMIPLPYPRDRSAVGTTLVVNPSMVVVLPADNVELTPNSDLTIGLTRQQADPQRETPGRGQEQLSYRGDLAESQFAADFRLRVQQIEVDVTSRLRLSERTCQVDQTFAYQIDHVPGDHLLVDVPRTLKPDVLTFRCSGKTLTATEIAQEGDASDASDPIRMRVALPGPRIGSCELELSYSISVAKLSTTKPVRWAIPLVMPGQGRLSSNHVAVSPGPMIRVVAADEQWSKRKPTGAVAVHDGELLLYATRSMAEVTLLASREDRRDREATVVDRAWVQTWLSDQVRADRVALTLTTSRAELTFQLPGGSAITSAQVFLDGELATTKVGEDGRRTLSLLEKNPALSHRLELRWQQPRAPSTRGSVSLELPKLDTDISIRRVYWQLVLPPNEHMVATPRGLTAEHAWGFQGMFFGRRPLLEQHQLESWIGVDPLIPTSAAAESDPLAGTNRYLFSSFGGVQHVQVQIAERMWIVLGASLLSLVAGLLLIHVPWARRPGPLLGLAVLLFAAGTLHPEPTLLLSQAAALGLALALIAGLLQRGFAQRRRASLVEPSSSILETGSTQSQVHLPPVANQGSTQSSPHVPPKNQDPQP